MAKRKRETRAEPPAQERVQPGREQMNDKGSAPKVDDATPEVGDATPEVDDATPEVEGATSNETEDDCETRFIELREQHTRLLADFDNYRRRTRANEAAVREQAAAGLIAELLPVIDNLQLALSRAEGAAAPGGGFSEGVGLIEQQLLAVLHGRGLQPLDSKGQLFDPQVMEAVAQVDGQGHVEPGHVLEELRRGYMLHERVLRTAQVIVAQTE